MNERAATAISAAARYYGITPQEVVSRTQTRTPTKARQAAFAALHQIYGWSKCEIGRHFGRDHTTVISGIPKADPAAVAYIIDAIQNPTPTHPSGVAGHGLHADRKTHANGIHIPPISVRPRRKLYSPFDD